MKRLYIITLLLLLGITGFYPFIQHTYAADEVSAWLRPEQPNLEAMDELGPNDSIPFRINGNRDCETRKVITRPFKVLPFWPFVQSEQSHESCVVNARFGGLSTSGYVQFTGNNTSGRVRQSNGSSLTMLAGPRSPHAIYLSGAPHTGVYAFLVRDFAVSVSANTIFSGEVEYRLLPTLTPIGLADKMGNLIPVHTDSISFSSNGRWMVADSPSFGTLRVDMETFEVLPFGEKFNYNVGVAPGVQTTITNDGRFAVVSSPSFTRFKLFDLDTCAQVPGTITGSVSCSSRDLLPFMNERVQEFGGATNLRFTHNYSLHFYAKHKDAANKFVVSPFILTAPGEVAIKTGYLALGDSFASGEGAYDYKALTDTRDNKCHLSQVSYPYLIGSEIGLNLAESVACSGAVTNDLTSTEDTYEGQVNDKIQREDRANEEAILASFSPGYVAQWEFVDLHKPSVITVSAIGNDIGFADKIKRCLEPDTCYASHEDRLEIFREVNQQFNRLTGMYRELKNASDPRAKIYVIGYPQIAKPEGNCGANVLLNAAEIDFAAKLVSHLNQVIKAAADQMGVFYVDVEDAFNGRMLCETTYSNTAVNGLTAGDDIIDIPFLDIDGPVGNESYHPNALGHRLFKTAIIEKTNGLTAEMPEPKSTNPPDENTSPLLVGAPKSGRELYNINFDDEIGNNMATRGGIYGAVIKGGSGIVRAFSPIKAWLNSEPAHLGDFVADGGGGASLQLQIPEGTPPGFHTLHLYVTNMAGEPVDIYKIIYVAANETDFDGDGILNIDDECLMLDPSGIDYDKDGIDDVCDGIITEPPVEETPPEDNEPEEGEPATNMEEAKPPENNPETVAGHEQLAETPETTPAVSTTQTPTANTTPYLITAPAQGTQTESESTPQPEVAGISSTIPNPSKKATAEQLQEDSQNYWYLSVVVLFVSLAGGLFLKKLSIEA